MKTFFQRLSALFLLSSLLIPASAFAQDMNPLETALGLRGGLHVRGNITLQGRAKITAIADTSITVEDKNLASLTLLTDDTTRYTYLGGTAQRTDFIVGDEVRLFARQNFYSQLHLARLTNVSVRATNLYGHVSNITSDSFILQTSAGKDYTVMLNNDTNFVFSDGGGFAGPSNLQNGMTVRAYGKLYIRENTIRMTRVVRLYR